MNKRVEIKVDDSGFLVFNSVEEVDELIEKLFGVRKRLLDSEGPSEERQEEVKDVPLDELFSNAMKCWFEAFNMKNTQDK